jgi:hypothetical protein
MVIRCLLLSKVRSVDGGIRWNRKKKNKGGTP